MSMSSSSPALISITFGRSRGNNFKPILVCAVSKIFVYLNNTIKKNNSG